MKIWVNAQLPPAIAHWLVENFAAARNAAAIVMTKDSDFVELVNDRGTPPQVIWLTCGNTTNARLREILAKALPQAIKLLEAGEAIVEISGM